MSPAGVEHAAFASVWDPRVRLVALIIPALREHNPIRVVLGVNITLVPTFNRSEALHHGMVAIHDRFFENSRAVTFELATDQFDVFGRIQKTETRKMNWHKSMPNLNVFQQCFFLLW